MTKPEPDEVRPVEAGRRAVARRATVHAPAAELFAIVADPHRHYELDGSGTLRNARVEGPHRLSIGTTFGIGMRQLGVPYRITSTVTQFEAGRLLEWQHPMGHRWRWEFAETEPGRTQVTETFDYSSVRLPKILEIGRFPAKNEAGMTSTLQALMARFA